MNEGFLKALKEYWFILAFVVSLVITWTQFSSRITALEVAHARLEQRVDVTSASVNTMQTDIAEIKANLQFIKDYLVK